MKGGFPNQIKTCKRNSKMWFPHVRDVSNYFGPLDLLKAGKQFAI